jgi:uncharacterized protein (DUF488 family)
VTRLLTVGHGTASEEELGGRLREAGVAALVDVRTAPGSRRLPHVGRDRMAQWLPAYDVTYRWDKRLGGFRKLPPDSPDTVWRNNSFRAYAAWMREPEFLAAIDDLLAGAANECTTVMCSESVWWRCHRRMIADFATLSRGFDVGHLMPDGRLAEHRLSEGARLTDERLIVYDGRPS